MFSHIKTTIKTLLLVAVMALGMIVIGWAALSGLSSVNTLSSQTTDAEIPGLLAVTQASTSIQHISRAEKNLILETDPGKLGPYKQVMEEEYRDLDEAFTHINQYFYRPEAKRLIAELTAAKNDWLAVHKQVVVLGLRSDIPENFTKGRDLSMGESRIKVSALEKLLEELTAVKVHGLKEAADQTAQTYSSVRITMFIVLFLVIIAGGLIGLLFSRSIMRQLGDEPSVIAGLAEKIASGDLSTTFNAKITFGVYDAIHRMAENLKAKIGEAEGQSRLAARETETAKKATEEAQAARRAAESAKREGMLAAAEQLASVVERMTSATEQLSAQVEESSRGASTQKKRMGETSVGMEEMNATVLEVARNASAAADLSGKSKDKALEGAGMVNKVVSAIGQVQTLSSSLKTEMSELGKQAEDIGQVMNVISDIADQTNLLALNAAIEAARAGEAGRGFAVVADEVRKLAEKTMQATKQVGDAISGIQQGARRSATSVDNSVKSIIDTTDLARHSGEALAEIVKLAETTSDQVRSIATASEEQSAASEEITRGMERINQLSDELAITMNQSALAVSEVAQQSQTIQRIITGMKNA